MPSTPRRKTGIRDSAVDCRQRIKSKLDSRSGVNMVLKGWSARYLNSEMRKLWDYSIWENKFQKISIRKHFSIWLSRKAVEIKMQESKRFSIAFRALKVNPQCIQLCQSHLWSERRCQSLSDFAASRKALVEIVIALDGGGRCIKHFKGNLWMIVRWRSSDRRSKLHH